MRAISPLTGTQEQKHARIWEQLTSSEAVRGLFPGNRQKTTVNTEKTGRPTLFKY